MLTERFSKLLPDKAPALAVVLTLGCALSALGIVQSTHRARMLYTDLEQRESHAWTLEENWSRLLLEHSTWAAHHRVERLARRDLGMRVPGFEEIELVVP